MRLFSTKWIPLLAAAAALAATLPASAQIDALRKVLGSDSAGTKAGVKETPEQVAERLSGWQKEARQTLGSLDTPGAAAALPAGISADELESYKRDLELLALTITQIADKADLAKSDPKAKRQIDPAEWTGFDEPPPYSVLLLDELLNERDAAERKLAAAQSSRSNYQHLLDAATADGKAADQLVGQRISEVESAGEEARDAAKWRLAAASVRTRLVTCRIHALNLLLSKLEDTITRTRAEIVLLDKKASVARSHLRFNDEDIRSIEKITSQRKAKLDEEADKVAARIKAARISQSEARKSLDALEAEAAAGGTPVGMELARFRLEVADGRLDVLQNLAEGLENLSHLETVTLQIYKDRLALQNAIAPEERARHISALRDFHERLSAAVTALGNEFATNSADLTKLEARASSVLDDDPRLPLINEQRVLKGEKIAMYQRLIQSGESLDRMVTRWLDEAVPKEEDPGIQNVLGRAKAAFGKIWNFELFSFENTIELDSGEIQKGRVPVTAGMLIRASLFFLICYWIAARFA
ncbi:MAG: hypothetical protein KDN05_18165, partial [Verrucomicrobiae bacterium]|nr:hypothetical protein [Verrucomicrobiae bacterium]